MIKDLRDWKKESERKNKNKHQWGWFQHSNAGNVEYNIDFFNHVTGADSGDTSVLAGSVGDGGMGESLDMNDTVELYYDDIEVSGYYGPTDWETGYPEKEYNETVSWVYTVDRDDIFVDLEDFIAEENPELSDGQLEIIVSENFEELVDKYYQQLLDKYRKYAEEDANEKYEYDEYDHYLDAMGESVNIREALNKIDCNTCGKYDLLNMYDCSDMPVEKKAKLAEMLKENVSADKLYEYMDEESPWQIGLELFADNGHEYKVISVLDEREVDGYELSIVGAIGNELSNADEEVYFVLLDSDIEWGPVDTAQEAIEWASDVRDGYYNDDDEDDFDSDDDIDFIDLYGVHDEYDDKLKKTEKGITEGAEGYYKFEIDLRNSGGDPFTDTAYIPAGEYYKLDEDDVIPYLQELYDDTIIDVSAGEYVDNIDESLNGSNAKKIHRFETDNLTESKEDTQYGVHSFSQSSIIFRGTEEECAEFIADHNLWDDAEIYAMTPDDPHYLKEAEEDGLENATQEYTSANTSINSTKLPAIFSMVNFKPETINLDYGGGKFDNATAALEGKGVTNLVYDPYNRSSGHNKDVIDTIRKNGGADTATCSNVLNVIKEPAARTVVIKNIYKLLKPNGVAYFTVYEGTGKGDEGPTKAGYQLNKKTADYVEEISSVFPSVSRRGKLIVASKGSVTEEFDDDWSDTLETGGEPTYCPDCGVRFVRDEEGDAVCPECNRTPHQIAADAQRKAMFANGYKESIKKACRRGNAMNEGTMKEIDLEVQKAGGVDAYIDSLESQLRKISREMRLLRGQARREMKAGGAYDSVNEINDALKATEKEYNEVRKKYDYISSQQTGGVN